MYRLLLLVLVVTGMHQGCQSPSPSPPVPVAEPSETSERLEQLEDDVIRLTAEVEALQDKAEAHQRFGEELFLLQKDTLSYIFGEQGPEDAITPLHPGLVPPPILPEEFPEPIPDPDRPEPPAPERVVEAHDDALSVAVGENFKDESGAEILKEGYPVSLSGIDGNGDANLTIWYFESDGGTPNRTSPERRVLNLFPYELPVDSGRLVIHGVNEQLRSVRHTVETVKTEQPTEAMDEPLTPPPCPCD